ncbi:MAG TPA: hypothetical protein PKC84_12580 [Paracoccaceae bacterium]|nr:hypothetical protein [Paracoccaceae bacterium]
MTDMQAPPDLAEWSLHCFCLGARETPHRLVRTGQNGTFLHGLRAGPAEAEAGADPAALERMALIRRDRGRWAATFPMLGPATILPLRGAMQDLALRLRAATADRHAVLEAALDDAGFGAWRPAIEAGHVWDGLLWDRLRGPLSIPDTRPEPAVPGWRGVFWAVWPGVPGAIGTNEVAGDGVRLVLVWTPATATALDRIRRAPWAPAMLGAIAQGGALPPGAVAAGLADAAGRPRFPVLGDPALAAVDAAAAALADALAAGILSARDALDALPGLPPGHSAVILLHELIWAATAGAAFPDPDHAVFGMRWRRPVIGPPEHAIAGQYRQPGGGIAPGREIASTGGFGPKTAGATLTGRVQPFT